MEDIINILDLGKRDYKEVWDMQKELHFKRVNGQIPNILILVEHNPVVTLGKSGKSKNIKMPAHLLKEKGIDFYHVERGGDVTFHGPGQLVGYPIFNIKKGLIGIRKFIEMIEDTIINVLADFDIKAEKRERLIGVWTEMGKICSIGIAVKRWVSFHGFALNVNIDLRYFDLINPCGFKDIKIVSMQEILGHEISMTEVKKSTIKNFHSIFLKSNW